MGLRLRAGRKDCLRSIPRAKQSKQRERERKEPLLSDMRPAFAQVSASPALGFGITSTLRNSNQPFWFPNPGWFPNQPFWFPFHGWWSQFFPPTVGVLHIHELFSEVDFRRMQPNLAITPQPKVYKQCLWNGCCCRVPVTMCKICDASCFENQRTYKDAQHVYFLLEAALGGSLVQASTFADFEDCVIPTACRQVVKDHPEIFVQDAPRGVGTVASRLLVSLQPPWPQSPAFALCFSPCGQLKGPAWIMATATTRKGRMSQELIKIESNGPSRRKLHRTLV